MAERRPPGFNVDLGFYDGPQVRSIPRRIRAAAIGVWTLCGSYSANKLTDGYVDAETLKHLGCTPAIRAALMATRGANGEPDPLWIDADNGAIQFTRWKKWQRTRAEVKAFQNADAERKKASRKAAKQPATMGDSEMSARTDTGPPPNVPPDDGDPKTKTETETKTCVVTNGTQPQTAPPNGATHTPLSDFCPKHPHGTTERCGDCANIRKTNQARQRETDTQLEHQAAEAEQRRIDAAELRRRCTDCDESGWLLDDDDQPVEPAQRCTHITLREDLAHA